MPKIGANENDRRLSHGTNHEGLLLLIDRTGLATGRLNYNSLIILILLIGQMQ
jgi:hypothetical protein